MSASFAFETAFVCRNKEMGMLDERLNAAMRGEGGAVLIEGDRGTGKTRLIDEFCHLAGNKYIDLIIERQDCISSMDTAVRPYQPFENMLPDLFRHRGRRPKEAIQKVGRDLVSWLSHPQIEYKMDYGGVPYISLGLGDPGIREKSVQQDVSQYQMAEQFIQLAFEIASRRSLVLVLDELHNASSAAVELFRSLACRIWDERRTEKILIVGAYSPADSQDGAITHLRTDLESRFLGVTLDLNAISKDRGHEFIRALLSSQRNDLGDDFLSLLFDHTGGQPMFVIETLRVLHDRGTLVYDERGQWTIKGDLEPDSIPSRVEAEFDKRFNKLDKEGRSIVTCASVMGDTFTAEVISLVRSIESHYLLDKLSQELEQQHRLIKSAGTRYVKATDQHLNFFSFIYSIFRRAAYHHLTENDQTRLHLAIARALKSLYGEESASIAQKLAHHFQYGCEKEEAARYYEKAGDQMKQDSAYSDAVKFYGLALGLIEDDLAWRYKLLSVREVMNEELQARAAQACDLEEMERIADRLENSAGDSKRATVHNRWCVLKYRNRKYDEAVKEAEVARKLAFQDGDKTNEAFALLNLGRAYYQLQKYSESILNLSEGLERYVEIGSRSRQADCLYWWGLSSWYVSEPEAMSYFERALAIQAELKDPKGMAYSNRSLGNYYLTRDLKQAEHFLLKCQSYRELIGDRSGREDTLGDREHGLAAVKADLALVYCYRGEYPLAEKFCNDSILIMKTAEWPTAWAPGILALNNAEQGKFATALSLFEEYREYFTKNPAYAARYRHELARVQFLTNDIQGSLENAREAVHNFSDMQQLGNHSAALALSARILRAVNKPDQALIDARQAAKRLDSGSGTGFYRPQEIWFDCFKGMESITDRQEAFHALQQAHEWVINQAGRLSDPQLRQSFLTKVRLNQQIEMEWQMWQARQ